MTEISTITLDDVEHDLSKFSDGVRTMVETVSELRKEQSELKSSVETYLKKVELDNAKIEALAFVLNQKLVETVKEELESAS